MSSGGSYHPALPAEWVERKDRPGHVAEALSATTQLRT